MKDKLRKIDKPLLIVTMIMVVFGLIMVFSSSSVAAVLQYNQTEFFFFKKQLITTIIGLIISIIVLFFPTKNYSFLSRILLVLIIIVLISLKTYGTVTNSAKSWFRVLGMSIQPSEFAKTVIIIYLACAYGNRKKFKTVSDLFIPLVPCVAIFGFVALEPDLGTAAIIAAICAFIFFALPISKNKTIHSLRLLGVVGIVASILFLNFNSEFLTDTQANRFNYKSPCSRYLEETGYQVCNGYIAIHNGGLFGSGLGNSVQKYLYLPESHTDFIFPIIVEELGYVGGALVLIGYVIILYRILVIARNANNLRNSIIAFGTFAYILMHIFVNIGGLLALIPLTGVPLPFISYGGSFMINILFLVGLVQRVAIESKSKKGV